MGSARAIATTDVTRPRPPLPQRALERNSPPRLPEPQRALWRTSPRLPPVFLAIFLLLERPGGAPHEPFDSRAGERRRTGPAGEPRPNVCAKTGGSLPRKGQGAASS